MSQTEDALKAAVATLVADVAKENAEVASLVQQLAAAAASGDAVPAADVQAITQQIQNASSSIEAALAAANPAPAAPPAGS